MKRLPRCLLTLLLAALAIAALASPSGAVVLTEYITQWGTAGSGNGQFDQPVGVAVDASGNVYVTDMGNDRVQVFNGTGVFQFSFGASGSGPGQFRRPYGIAINGGDLYVVDTGNYRVEKFTLAGVYVAQWGTQGAGNGKFQRPRGVAADGLGNVVVTDDSLDLVQRFNPPGTFQVQWGSTGNGNGQFRGPIGIGTDGMNAFFVADSANHRIQQFNGAGVWQASWGGQGAGNGQFQSPLGVTAYNFETIVADAFNDRMQKFDFSLAYSAKWGTTGTGNGQFVRPHASAADGAFLYVADTGNHRIQKFGPRTDGACAACNSPAEICCEALPHVGGPWTNALVGTRDAFPGGPYPYCVTVFDLSSAPLPAEDANWASMTRYTGPGVGWNADSLGSVFGLTLDQYGNIFVAHTSCYKNDFLGQVFGGGAGAIYRIDANTGAIKTFCKLPNLADPNVTPGANYPGLGNITYDCQHQQFFATDLEDGRIYRIQPVGVNGVTGTVVESFDPLGPDDGTPGWTPIGERLWGVQVHGNRVFYSVWALEKDAGSTPNEIRSVGLTGTGAFAAGTDQHELYLPLLAYSPFSNPVADISFSSQGRMLLGERGIFAKTDTDPHFARVLEYECSAGCWIPGNTYKTGSILPEENAEGGVDYDVHAFTGAGAAIGRVWATTDAMHYIGIAGQTDYLYGYQGLRPNLPNGSHLNSMLVDSDGQILDASEKSYTGDIEAPGCVVPPETGALCGQKYKDVNRNGVKDGTEPGVAGWTLQLVGPGGTYTATTDANGNYCFTNVLNGSYTLGEIGQAAWIQTAPPGGTYAITILGGQTLTGYLFGNSQCATFGPPCAQTPPMTVARWPFDEAASTAIVSDVAHVSPSHNVAHLFGGAAITSAGQVNNALCFTAPSDVATVPRASQFDLDFASNSFAISAWLNPGSSSAGPRLIVEKRLLDSGTPYRTTGWALYLVGQQSFLEIGTGVATQVVPGPKIPAGTWTHLAVSVDRSAAGAGRWYVDGGPVTTFDFAPLAGSVTSAADLTIGQVSPPFGAAPGFQGCIDDLVLFASPAPPTSILPAASVAKVFNAGNVGLCPEYASMPQVTTLCKTATSAQVCLNLCSNYPTPQSYHWSLAGLPVGPGCTVAGPTIFSPASGTITVGPGCSPPICVTIARPAGLTAQNATSCFALTFVNDATGQCTTRRGTLRADNTCWCATPVQQGLVSVPARVVAGTGISIGIGHPCDPVGLIHYSLSAVWLDDDHADPQALRLNGLPPGTPVTGDLTHGSTGDELLTVNASFVNGYDPAAPYEIVLDADTDGDGVMERQCGTIVVSTYDSAPAAGVVTPPLAVESLRLRMAPNPFLGGSTLGFSLSTSGDVDLSVVDLNGRLVRSLQRGRLAAGEYRFEWNGRDERGHRAAAGVYFVRLNALGQHLNAKLVKLR